MAGPVAVGKSTIAAALASELGAAVLGTDAFLLPNAALAERGLSMRKGFPESFDTDAIVASLTLLRDGARRLEVPCYSHDVYDVVEGAVTVVDVDVDGMLVLEGVNVLQGPVADLLDVGVYVDAPEDTVRAWFVERFRALVAAAETQESSFYTRFAGLTQDRIRGIAEATWAGVNAVNLRDHIAPSRARADLVVLKRADHSIESVTESRRVAPNG